MNTGKHAWSGNRTPTGRVTSGRANHNATTPGTVMCCSHMHWTKVDSSTFHSQNIHRNTSVRFQHAPKFCTQLLYTYNLRKGETKVGRNSRQVSHFLYEKVIPQNNVGRWPSALERWTGDRVVVGLNPADATLLWNFGNSVYPALPVYFGGDTKNSRSLLSGVYAKGNKGSHAGGTCKLSRTRPLLEKENAKITPSAHSIGRRRGRRNDTSCTCLQTSAVSPGRTERRKDELSEKWTLKMCPVPGLAYTESHALQTWTIQTDEYSWENLSRLPSNAQS